MNAAMERLLQAPIGSDQKAFPPALSGLSPAEVGEQGLSLRAGDLLLPVMVLHEEALAHNLETMARWCRRHSVSLAPHGKTTMAPQLFHRQLEAGAWAITAATVSQAAIMRQNGVPRVLIANEVLDPAGIGWLAQVMDEDPGFEVFCLVDSAASVARLDRMLAARGAGRPLPVLVELGVESGRAGARGDEEASAVAAAVAASDRLVLAGVECFEGVIGPGVSAAAVERVEALLGRVRALARELDAAGLFADVPEILLSAGGSVFFDRAARLDDVGELSRPVRVVVRGGCYLTHDDGAYEELSPFGAAREDSEESDRLWPALELWSAVLSRPEPELAIIGFGKRDAPYDAGLPRARRIIRADLDVPVAAGELEVLALNDQHAMVRVAPGFRLEVGETVTFGISHPCTAFDKWSLLPVVNGSDEVIGAVRTFF